MPRLSLLTTGELEAYWDSADCYIMLSFITDKFHWCGIKKELGKTTDGYAVKETQVSGDFTCTELPEELKSVIMGYTVNKEYT